MRLTIENLFIFLGVGRGIDERSAGILARKLGELNPPYAGHRVAADLKYRPEGAPCSSNAPIRRINSRYSTAIDRHRPRVPLYRHLAVQDRRAGGEAFGGIDDGVGVDAIGAIEIVDGAGLAEDLDTERLDAM